MKKVSVCIASYNGEAYIEKQLLSILSQLETYDEVIISDDNSFDRTLHVISEMKDDRIKVIINKGRSGPVSNFEHALRHVTGDYIILADQDDFWLRNKVEVTRSLLNDYDLILSDCQIVDENDLILYSSFFNYRHSQPGFWHNLYKNSYIGCCMAFRKEVLAYALPFPEQIYMHDWWIGLLVEIKGEICFYPKPLIKYVRHGNNVSPTGGKSPYSLLKQLNNRFFLLLYIAKRLKSIFTS